MARERSASAGAEKDSKDAIVKQITKPGVTSSSASGNRGRERERRRRGGSASSSSSSSGSSSSSSSSSRTSSGSSSSSSSSGSSSTSSSSSGSDRGGARGGGSSRSTGRKAISASPRRSKSPIAGNKLNARKDSKERNNRRSKDRSRRSANRDRDRDTNIDLQASKKNSKDHGRSSRTRSRSPITRSPRRGGRNADNHITNRRRERSPTPRPVRIHVGRLTRNVTKEHVMEIFSCFGEVKHVEFPTDRVHPSFGRGIAYVEYATPEDCENAMKQMDGGQIDGQEVACSPVHPQRVFPPIRRKTPPMRRPRWRTPPFNRFNHRGGGNFRSPIRRRSPRRRSRSPIRRRRRSVSSDSSR